MGIWSLVTGAEAEPEESLKPKYSPFRCSSKEGQQDLACVCVCVCPKRLRNDCNMTDGSDNHLHANPPSRGYGSVLNLLLNIWCSALIPDAVVDTPASACRTYTNTTLTPKQHLHTCPVTFLLSPLNVIIAFPTHFAQTLLFLSFEHYLIEWIIRHCFYSSFYAHTHTHTLSLRAVQSLASCIIYE